MYFKLDWITQSLVALIDENWVLSISYKRGTST
jgi:hypothetical protein